MFGGDFNENTSYSTYTFTSKECVDTYWVSKSEYNYETIDCISCTRLLFSRYCQNSYNSAFLFNCRNCHDCFGCVNLTNKSYQIFNIQYSKEEYSKKIKEFDLSKYSVIQDLKIKFKEYMTLLCELHDRVLSNMMKDLYWKNKRKASDKIGSFSFLYFCCSYQSPITSNSKGVQLK